MDNELVEYGVELGYGDAFMKLAATSPEVAAKKSESYRRGLKKKFGLGKYDPKQHGTWAQYQEMQNATDGDMSDLGTRMGKARETIEKKKALRDARNAKIQEGYATGFAKKKPSFLQRAGDTLGSYARRTQGFVRNNPGKAALIGAGLAGAGYGAYRLMKKRKEEKDGIKKAAEFLHGYING